MIGPVTTVLSNIVAAIILALINFQPAIAGFVIGTFWSLLVMFGLHWGIIPLWFIDVATYGYDPINPLVYAGGCAIIGAVIGVIVRSKDAQENADVNVPALISSIFGVNEPALYAILIPRKKLMWATFISAGIGGAIAGLAGASSTPSALPARSASPPSSTLLASTPASSASSSPVSWRLSAPSQRRLSSAPRRMRAARASPSRSNSFRSSNRKILRRAGARAWLGIRLRPFRV